jgi:DNA-binding response OmpR family regulator
MKIINSIVVFDNDKYLLALLNGYCFANHIALASFGFNIKSVNKLKMLTPVLALIPINLLGSEKAMLAVSLLRRITDADGQIKICGLNKTTIQATSKGLSPWIDAVINKPYDIGMIDGCLQIADNLVERRSIGERRLSINRRQDDKWRAFQDTRKKAGRVSLVNKTSTTLKQADVTDKNIQENPKLRGLQIDRLNKCVHINGSHVQLTPKEFELVELLLTETDRVFTADEIIKHLWPESYRATKSDLYQYMHLVRKKIEHDPNNPQWLKTVKGFGYKLDVDSHQENVIKKYSHYKGSAYG